MLQTWRVHNFTRYLTTKVLPKSIKAQKSPKPPKEYKVSNDIVEYFTTNNEKDVLDTFHYKVLRKKHKPPDSFYLANKRGAELIAEHLIKLGSKLTVLLESNPGPGLLTAHLIQSGNTRLHLFESNEHFAQQLRENYGKHSKRVKVHDGDLANLWKLAFQDRMDNGNRVLDLLADIPKKDWTNKSMRLYAGIGSLNFFKHLIASVVHQTSFFAHGRLEMFLVMPPLLYLHLTCSNEAGYLLYRANTMLFQILFEHKFLNKIPREYFIPWQYEQKISKQAKLTKFNTIDSDYLYLIKILPRQNIFELCPLEDMQALWYFVRQNCISRKHRVIPNLEKWAPGCGPRLIINTERSQPVRSPREKSDQIPKFSVESVTMSKKDFYPNMNIFTEFGDLSPSQMLTLFCQFRKWPEYKESPFLASLENSLLRMETSDHENTDVLDGNEENYVVVENKSNETYGNS